MADFLLIAPDGEITEHEGFASGAVGCHGSSGQNLWDTSEGFSTGRQTLRVVACDCCLVFREEHPENRYAYVIVGRAGYVQKWGGAVAIERVAWDGESVPLRDVDVLWVRRMAALVKLAVDGAASDEVLLDKVSDLRPPWRAG